MQDYGRYFGRGGVNDRVDVDRLVEEIELDREELEWRKAFVGFDESDAHRLERFSETFEAHAGEIADMFYGNLIAHEETREVLARSPKTVEKLKRTQEAYLVTLAGGDYDLEYFRNRARIGKIHDVLEMPMNHYIGQYGVYYDLILPLVVDRITEGVSEAIREGTVAEPNGGVADAEEGEAGRVLVDVDDLESAVHRRIEDGIDGLHSILKVLNLDMQVAADTYIHSYTKDVEAERDRFAALFGNLPNPVAGLRVEDGESHAEIVNPAFEEVFGYTAEEFGDRPLEDVLRPPDVEPRSFETGSVTVEDIADRPESELDDLEVTLETVSGRRDFVRISAPIDRDGVEQDEFAFFVDVTRRKQRRERLEVLSRALRHDIRNQMNLVGGHASTLADALEEETHREMAAEIETAAERLLSISEGARTAQRLIGAETDSQPIDVHVLLEEVVEEGRRTYPDCVFDVSVSDTLSVQGPEALRVALEQVLENAVEHNDAPEPRVEVTAVPTLDGEYVDVRVADNGPGIPPAEYELFTGERDRSQIEHASGLGLWTANWAVKNAGGDLAFDANSPRGTIVTLRLRRVDS